MSEGTVDPKPTRWHRKPISIASRVLQHPLIFALICMIIGAAVVITFSFNIDAFLLFIRQQEEPNDSNRIALISAVVGGCLAAALGVAGAYFAAVKATRVGMEMSNDIALRAEANQDKRTDHQAKSDEKLSRWQSDRAEVRQQRTVLVAQFRMHSDRLFDLGIQMADDVAELVGKQAGRTSGGRRGDLELLERQLWQARVLVSGAMPLLRDCGSLRCVHEAFERTSELINESIEGKHPWALSLADQIAVGEDPDVALGRFAAAVVGEDPSNQEVFLRAIDALNVDKWDRVRICAIQETLDELGQVARQRRMDPAFTAAKHSPSLVVGTALWLGEHAVAASTYLPEREGNHAPRLRISPALPSDLADLARCASERWACVPRQERNRLKV